MHWSEYGKELLEKCKQSERPFQACFELTPFCNFKCNMCYVRLTPEEANRQGRLLSLEQWVQIAEEAKQMGTIMLEVTGGEPTIRNDFSDLYKALINMGYLIHLRTNGYLINGDILSLLQKLKPRKISVTLYGASDETYQKVCGVSDGFSVVTKNIIAMKEAGLNIRLSMTVTMENIDDQELVKEWANTNGLDIEPYGALITPIRSAKRSIDYLQVKHPSEDFVLPEDLKSVQYSVSDRDTLMNPFWLCRGFGALFCISWDGRMTLCNTLTDVWSDPLNDGVNKAYHILYEKLKQIRRPRECAACQYIEFCAACPSKLQSSTGCAEKTNEEVCKFARRKFKHYMLMRENQSSIERV